jgi:hypothetical protein
MNAMHESIAEAARAAASEIRGSQEAPAGKAKQVFADALDRIVRVRNERIRTRSAGDAAQDDELQRLNAILSLMAGIEFPLGGFHRERLVQVEQALQALQEHART